jgi:hypothetical protein
MKDVLTVQVYEKGTSQVPVYEEETRNNRENEQYIIGKLMDEFRGSPELHSFPAAQSRPVSSAHEELIFDFKRPPSTVPNIDLLHGEE